MVIHHIEIFIAILMVMMEINMPLHHCIIIVMINKLIIIFVVIRGLKIIFLLIHQLFESQFFFRIAILGSISRHKSSNIILLLTSFSLFN